MLLLLLSGCAALAQSSGSVITGVVRNATTKLPVEGAQVSLLGETSTGVETDAHGAFHFSGLTEAAYTVRVEAPGFQGPAMRNLQPQADPITVDLYPLARLEGRVLDEDGDPVEGVIVDARVEPYHHGVPYLGASTTSKDGRFQLVNLGPAVYVIHLAIPAALRSAGYPAAEYYPGVTDVERAATVAVAEGTQLAAFDLRLRRFPMVTLKGRVLDLAKREAAPPIEVAIDSEPSAVLDRYARHPLDAESRFHFESVPPGRHKLQIFRGGGSDDLPYVATIEAGKEEVTVAVPPFTSLHGIVRSTVQQPWEGVLGIGLGTEAAWRRIITPDEDGSFTLPEVPPGNYTLRLESNNLQAGGRMLRIASARFGATNVIAKPLTVTESGNPPIEILLTDESGVIAGTVETPDQSEGALVVVQRTDDTPMTPENFAQAKADGSFTFGSLLPGEYRVAAWTDSRLRKGAFGADCTGRISNVTVLNGQTVTLKLKPCN
ncbi:MAG TPA: carboxypeptidase-like regulatory domain-containing protein [Candidatus Sulfopaludibacter sp.]|nr:carboxypeptidase-like regulatory domain-containing protein [Candidatus Sulfopaludibacter sp.]